MRKSLSSILLLAALTFAYSCNGTADPTPTPTPEPEYKYPDYELKVVAGITKYSSDGKSYVNEKIAKGTMKLSADDSKSYYTMVYTIDEDKTEYKLNNIWAGEAKEFSLPETLELGKHVIKGRYSCNDHPELAAKAMDDEVFYIMGDPLSEKYAKFVTAQHEYVLPADESGVLELPFSDYGDLVMTYKPESTVVTPVIVMDPQGFITFSEDKAKLEPGKITIPYKVKDKVQGKLTLKFTNGSEENAATWTINTAGKDIKYVESFTIAGKDVKSQSAISIALPEHSKDTKQSSFTVSCYPESCEDAKITSVTSGDETICKVVSKTNLGFVLSPVYKGTCKITVKVGKITNQYDLTVTGDVLTGYSLQSGLSDRQFAINETFNAMIQPVPSTAFDADAITVTSSDPSVFSVSAKGNNVYAFKALNYGSATITVKASDARSPKKSFAVKCDEYFTLPSGTLEIPWRGDATYAIGGSYSNFTYTYKIEGESGTCGEIVTRDGNNIKITNKILRTAARTMTISLTSAITKAKATMVVNLKPASGNLSLTKTVQVGSGSSSLMFRADNQTSTQYSWSKVRGFIVSAMAYNQAYATVDELKADMKLELAKSFPGDIVVGGKVCARYFDLMKGTGDPGISGGVWTVKAFQMGTLTSTLSHTSDGYGNYDSGNYLFFMTNNGSGDKYDF